MAVASQCNAVSYLVEGALAALALGPQLVEHLLVHIYLERRRRRKARVSITGVCELE